MTIGASGGIWQGTGSFASPTTGLKIYNSSGVGRLSTYNAGLEQITINSTGQLAVGQGKVLLDREGLSFSTTSTYQASSALKFLDAAGRVYGKLYGYDAAFIDSMELSVISPDGTNSSVILASANGNAITRIEAGGASVSLSMGLSGYTSFDMIGVDELAAVGTMAKLGQARITGGLVVGDTTIAPLTGRPGNERAHGGHDRHGCRHGSNLGARRGRGAKALHQIRQWRAAGDRHGLAVFRRNDDTRRDRATTRHNRSENWPPLLSRPIKRSLSGKVRSPRWRWCYRRPRPRMNRPKRSNRRKP
jgi:hypothetical protein